MLVAAALASSPGVAHATDPKPGTGFKKAPAAEAPPPTGTVDERASKWLSLGNKAFKDGKFAEAEKAYHEAFVLKQVYDIAGNLAMAEFAQSKHRDAAEHLALAIRLFPVTGEPATREQMQKTFDQSKTHVGQVKVIVSSTRGAQVSVDGKTVGEAPLADDVFLEPGKHTISVTAKGYKDASKNIDVANGAASVVKLDLVLLPPEAAKYVEPPPPPRSKKPAVVLGVVAVVALGAGGALLGVGFGKKSQADTLRNEILNDNFACVPAAGNFDTKNRCAGLNSQFDSAYMLQNIGGVTMAVGGAVAIAAVTYLLLPPKRDKDKEQSPLKVVPVTGREQNGFLISGTF